MSSALAERVENARTEQPEAKSLLDLVADDRMQKQFEMALPRHISAARFTRIALTALRLNPRLLTCSQPSVLGGLMQAAQLGLEISDVRGQCYLIPRMNRKLGGMEATFQLGYRGMIDLAGRGGITVEPREVREGDRFDYEYGTDSHLTHKPALEDRGEVVAFYAVAHFPDGRRPSFEVMSRSEMEGHRDRFQSSKGGDNPWSEHFEAMGRKTMVRRLLNYLPLPVEVQSAIEADDRVIVTDAAYRPRVVEAIESTDTVADDESTPRTYTDGDPEAPFEPTEDAE